MTESLPFLALFTAVTGCLYVLVMRTFRRLRVLRRMRLAGGAAKRWRVEETFAERSADIRGAMGHGLGLLGAFMPLGEDDRAKIETSLRRAGFQSAGNLTVMLGAKASCLLAGFVAGGAVSVVLLPGVAAGRSDCSPARWPASC